MVKQSQEGKDLFYSLPIIRKKEYLLKKSFTHFSCDRVAYLEERAYWKFTIWSFFIASVSSLAVMLRMRHLNNKARRRAREVLSNGSIHH